MARLSGFLENVRTIVTDSIRVADQWSSLKYEYDAFTLNGVVITQADLDAVFGAGTVTVVQFNQALAAQQGLVDALHVPATASKLYRLRA